MAEGDKQVQPSEATLNLSRQTAHTKARLEESLSKIRDTNIGKWMGPLDDPNLEREIQERYADVSTTSRLTRLSWEDDKAKAAGRK